MTSIIQTETGTWWKAHEDKNGSIGNCKGRYDTPDAVPDACGSKKAVLANPRNGLASHTNVIRFDYRLRAGGPGFESIRQLLDGKDK
jgi:hypothetical protein